LLVTTLFPFNFSFKDGFSIKVTDSFDNSSSLSDQLGNVLLFLPLGFGLACCYRQKAWSDGETYNSSDYQYWPIVHSRGAGISAFKIPYFSDILTNTFGGFLGFCAFICASLKSPVTPRADKKKVSAFQN